MTRTAPGKWKVPGDSQEGHCSGMQFHKAVYDLLGSSSTCMRTNLVLISIPKTENAAVVKLLSLRPATEWPTCGPDPNGTSERAGWSFSVKPSEPKHIQIAYEDKYINILHRI